MSREKAAKEAANAMAQLYVFAAIEGILEGGTVIGGTNSQKAADTILKITKKERVRLLNLYDKRIAGATA